MLKFRILFALLILSQTSFSQSDTVSVLNADTRNFNQLHLDLNLSFDFETATVFGELDYKFVPLENDFKSLTLHSKSTVVKSVTSNSTPLKFASDQNHLYVTLDKSASKRDTISITIIYESQPQQGLYFFKPTKEIPEIPFQIWTQGQDNHNRNWVPCYDLPDDKITADIIVSVKNDLRVFSNGDLLEVKKGKLNSTFHWSMQKPFSTYLLSVVVGDHQTVVEKSKYATLEYNIPKEWAKHYKYFLGKSPNMMDFFSEKLLPYPYKRYAQTTVQDFEWGGMENVTTTTLNRRILHDENAVPNYSAEPLIAHEMAHQWFGDLLTCKTWDHIWLNEGITTFYESLWWKDYYGDDEYAYAMIQIQDSYFGESNGNVDSTKLNKNIPLEMLDGKAYDKGASILNLLRYELGDQNFDRAMKNYVNEFQNKNVVTEDLRKSFEKSLKTDLKLFFDQWVYGVGYPHLEIEYIMEDFGKVEMNVKQIQSGKNINEVFNFNLPVRIIGYEVDTSFTIKISEREEKFLLPITSLFDAIEINRGGAVPCKITTPTAGIEYHRSNFNMSEDIYTKIYALRNIKNYNDATEVYSALEKLSNETFEKVFWGVKMEIVSLAAAHSKTESAAFCKKIILQLINDKDARVREAAIRVLGDFPDKKIMDELKILYAKESNHYIKSACMEAIGKMNLEGSFEILATELKKSSHRNIIRRGIFEGFKAMKKIEALDFAEEYLKYKHSNGDMHLQDFVILDFVKMFALENRQKVLNIIAGALENPYFRTRIKAVELLAELDGRQFLPQLEKVYREDRRNVVRTQLAKAIRKLNDRD